MDAPDAASLAGHYSRFRVAERLLLTGHSHQAWPDVGFEAQGRAWTDAAELLDAKWERAFEQANRVREGFRKLLRDTGGEIALGQNTHELVTRFLSALPLRARPRLVTTDGEFHSARRQLDRLAEEGLEVVKVPAERGSRVAEALVRALDERTAAVLVSSVLFRNAEIVPHLDAVAEACARVGAELLVDAYHSLGVVPFSIPEMSLEAAFVVGGGYKYCQLGEGNCFLRFPADCVMRPICTGWYAEFDALADAAGDGSVHYGPGPARFAGSTYDPASHYRAAAVFAFFREQGLDAATLRRISQRQLARLGAALDALDLDPAQCARNRAVPLSELGGFLTLEAPRAGEIAAALRARGVFADARGTSLRMGPAPYVTDAQLDEAAALLGEVVAQRDAGSGSAAGRAPRALSPRRASPR